MTTKRLIHLWAGVALTIIGVMAVRHAHSAEIFKECKASGCVIALAGVIEPGDGDKFVKVINSTKVTEGNVVVLDSIGGMMLDGLQIGMAVKKMKYDTLVLSNGQCESMCAAIWLAGELKVGQPGAHIGFHSVSLCSDKRRQGYNKAALNCSGKRVRSPEGTAMMVRYYTFLDLKPSAIKWLTEGDPNSIRWMDLDIADQLDIKVTIWDPNKKEETKKEETQQAEPTETLRLNPLSPTGLPSFEQIGKAGS